MTTRGLREVMASSGEVPEMQREKMERDRILRVMRWVYWDPKSRIKMRSEILLKKLEIKAVKFESKEETNEELGSWT